MGKFDENELKIVGEYTNPGIYGMPDTVVPKYNYPISPKENFSRLLRGEMPLWVPNSGLDANAVQPLVMPDADARINGGIDWFGIEWEFEPLSNAAMVKPGTRRLSELANWKEEIIWPDLSEIDWQKDYEENYKDKISEDRLTFFVIVNGLFERTADLTSFEDAFCALLEEPEVLTEFYDELVKWHIELMKIARDVYHSDMIVFHDDMGTQTSTFFSPDLYRELLVPQYKKITDAAHEMGMFVCLHSCGSVGTLVPYFIEAGFDAWEGQDNANDKKKIMDQYGEGMPHHSMLVVPEDLDDNEAVDFIHKVVDDMAMTGHYASWLIDTKEGRDINTAEELYRYSRTKLAELAE